MLVEYLSLKYKALGSVPNVRTGLGLVGWVGGGNEEKISLRVFGGPQISYRLASAFHVLGLHVCLRYTQLILRHCSMHVLFVLLLVGRFLSPTGNPQILEEFSHSDSIGFKGCFHVAPGPCSGGLL